MYNLLSFTMIIVIFRSLALVDNQLSMAKERFYIMRYQELECFIQHYVLSAISMNYAQVTAQL